MWRVLTNRLSALIVGAILGSLPRTTLASQEYVLAPGSEFTPVGGASVSLSGSFTWADPVPFYDPDYGMVILYFDATALDFQGAGISFRLNVSPANDCTSSFVPGEDGPRFMFFEMVDAFDGTGALVDPGLCVHGTEEPKSGGAPLVFPSLGVYRNGDAPDPELVGQIALSASAVPEPGPGLLIVGGLAFLYFSRRSTPPRVSGGNPSIQESCRSSELCHASTGGSRARLHGRSLGEGGRAGEGDGVMHPTDSSVTPLPLRPRLIHLELEDKLAARIR
jgi:hypothetical protein